MVDSRPSKQTLDTPMCITKLDRATGITILKDRDTTSS